VSSLKQLAEDISEHRKEVLGTDLASTVRSVLHQRSVPSHKPEMQAKELDVVGVAELAYSDKESGQRRRRRPVRRRNRRPPSPERPATPVEGQSASDPEIPSKILSSKHASFHFPPISKDQIRLATLFPGSLDDPINCSIQVISLSRLKTSKYEAVSYA